MRLKQEILTLINELLKQVNELKTSLDNKTLQTSLGNKLDYGII